jgi:DTW domain-containing protein
LAIPHESAVSLDRLPRPGRPIVLVVPDSTWRQATRLRKRIPRLREIPCIALSAGPPSSYRLRVGAHDEGLSTIEAIACAFGILEGPESQWALEQVLERMVERTLWSRGQLPAGAVTGGIPDPDCP